MTIQTTGQAITESLIAHGVDTILLHASIQLQGAANTIRGLLNPPPMITPVPARHVPLAPVSQAIAGLTGSMSVSFCLAIADGRTLLCSAAVRMLAARPDCPIV